MIKDYAKPQASGAQITPQRGWIALIFLILLMACLSLGVFFMVGKKHRSPSSLLVASAPVVRKIPPTPAVATKALIKQGLTKGAATGFNYDFYTMLPKNQSLPEAATPEGTMVEHRYFLQIASSRNFIEIKRLQEKLGKHGIDSRISSVVSNHTTWYRLESESYTQRSAIDEDLSRLHQMSLAPIIREQKAP